MSDKIELELLARLIQNQQRLTVGLTEWLLEHFYRFPDHPKNAQAALLQRWVGLLVQSLAEV